MELVRVLIGSESDGWLFSQDALLIGNELWLVPLWLLSPDGKWQRPGRAVRVDPLGFQRSVHEDSGTEVLLNSPMSKQAAYGDLPSIAAAGLEVVDGPSDRFPPIPRPLIQ